MIVAKIASQRAIISTKAAPGLCRPKKRIDQREFRTSWMIKITKAPLTPLLFNPLRQTKKAATPIKVKSVIQIGAKTQFGGANWGLTKLAYQVGIDGAVNIEPTTPAN